MAAGPAAWFIFGFVGGAVSFARLPLLQYILPVVLYPILEEWIFRANLLPAIRQKYPAKIASSPITIANLLTSLVFAGLHLFSHPPLWAVSVVFPSLVFGWAMERYKTLAAPIALHMFYNAGYFLLFA